MNQITNLWERATIISHIADTVYFSIPEEFWSGPESLLRSLHELSIEQLEEIRVWFDRVNENQSAIDNLEWKIKEHVNSLFTARLLIVAQISMNRQLVEKLLRKAASKKLD
jgi:hypothetical protein